MNVESDRGIWVASESASTPAEWLDPPPAERLTGVEPFIGIDGTVVEFWAYAMRDLRSNTVRGLLAEWLVTRATGATELLPDWHEFDVLTPEGIRVEVKVSAYLQAWGQRKLSEIKFSGLKARTWTPEHGDSPEAGYNAEVYVFCVQTARTHGTYRPLDVSQWTFYVLSRSELETVGYSTFSLATIQRLSTGAVAYSDLAEAIRTAGHRTSHDLDP